MLNKLIDIRFSMQNNNFLEITEKFNKNFEQYWIEERKKNEAGSDAVKNHTKGVMEVLLEFINFNEEAHSAHIGPLFMNEKEEITAHIYTEINKLCLQELKSFLVSLLQNKNKEEQLFWQEVINDFILFHDYQKIDKKEAFHEKMSADFYYNTFVSDKNLQGQEKLKKEITAFLIKNHIITGIPVIGELSSKAFNSTVAELNKLCKENNIKNPASFKEKVIKLLIVQGLADAAQTNYCFPSEVCFYYYLWQKIPALLKGERVYLPTQEGLATWAKTNGSKEDVPQANGETEFIYRIKKLTLGKLEVKDLTFNFETFDSIFQEIRYFKGIIHENTSKTALTKERIKNIWLNNFLQIVNSVNKFEGRSINKIILKKKDELEEACTFDDETNTLFVRYVDEALDD